ncbi:hypothetical protein Ahy_B06g084525 isoform C [Arachis hypogaea]|uniref:Uncharacterized protein n=1 Tax=Arachis hypogaea TaxID=3818 RepID=A0A444YS50_ARAHY|nr:hypothetical protein Ahy_B06g084525 isoform C [Arachis hypogaea]
MLLGIELGPLVSRILTERDILVRGIAHPLMFRRNDAGLLPDLASFDSFRVMGAVPVAATNLFKLLSSKSHILLYPGGMREALHRKVVLDYDDLVNIPLFKSLIEKLTAESIPLSLGLMLLVRWQINKYICLHSCLKFLAVSIIILENQLKLKEHVLKDREKSYELYLQVESEVEKCLAYLKEKRESDPYGNIVPRLLYKAKHGFDAEVPTFEI